MTDKPTEFALDLYAPDLADEEDKRITPKLELFIYWSEDGTPILELDTSRLDCDPDRSPILRIYLNDDVIYENPPFKPEE